MLCSSCDFEFFVSELALHKLFVRWYQYSEKVFVSQEMVSGFPEKGADLRGSLGNFRGSLGNFRGTSGLLLSSTVRELPGKSLKTSGEVRGKLPGKSGDFPEAQGSLTPYQRLAKFVSKISPVQISKMGRIRFRRVRFQTPNSVSFGSSDLVPGGRAQ